MLWPPGFYGQRSQQDSGSARRVVATQTLTKPPPPHAHPRSQLTLPSILVPQTPSQSVPRKGYQRAKSPPNLGCHDEEDGAEARQSCQERRELTF